MPRTKAAFEAMRERTRLNIERAALQLFARKGLSVTVGEIAATAAVSKGLLYSHYPSKEALIAQLVRQAIVISGQSIKELAESEAAAAEKIQQITALMCAMLATESVGIDYFMFMVQVGMSGFALPEALYDANFPNPIASLAQIIAAGQAAGSVVDGDPAQLASVYWATVQGLCCYAVSGNLLAPDPAMLSRILLKEQFL